MYCPECGQDAGDANFCPECGADLKGVKGALGRQGGRTTGQQRRKSGQSGQVAPAAAAPSQPVTGSRLSPAIIWGVFGVLAVVIVLVVILASGSLGGDSSATTTGTEPDTAAQPIDADTSGSYTDLVQRANGLYDEGQKKFQAQEYEQGSAYFQAASEVYAAAWKQKKTEAGVGTDYATSLFYSGNIDGAIKQVNVVIAKFPDFQSAYFNKGNYLAHQGRISEQNGDTKEAEAAIAEAKAAYAKAVSIDPASDAGKEADAQLQALND